MASVQSEYHRFLAYLEQRDVDHDVRRLALIVLNNLRPLAEVGATRRARSTRLAPIAVADLAETAATYEGDARGAEHGAALGRLCRLEVGPFRGFMRQETFDLSRDITLVYGANGTGKSSFCEALEAAMLGSIGEAQVKRIAHHTYCNNARLRRHTGPILWAGTADDIRIVEPDEAEYRFCFIEKNRLDDFARIAARTPGDQRQLIATLFGVDQFSEFVRGFNPSLDQDLMLIGPQAAELELRRQQLSRSEEVIASCAQRAAMIGHAEQALAQRMQPGATYRACVDWLLGTEQQQGRLPYVQGRLNATPPVVHEVTQAKLEILLNETFRVQALWQESSGLLAARATDVSYANLYEAVLALADGAKACPACGTGLESVTQNPFVRAREGLDQLAQLATLQQRERALRDDLIEAVRSLWEEMRRVTSIATNSFQAELQAAQLPIIPIAPSGNWLAAWVDGHSGPWGRLLRLSEVIEQADEEARGVHAQRRELAQEREGLDEFRLEIERLRTLRQVAEQELLTARDTVNRFEEENRELIQAVAEEALVVAHHQRVKAAYDGFLPELQGYLTELPAALLQGLGLQARDLYNAFNRADTPSDLLHALWLPVAENGKIEVEFVGEPGARYDALVILSEGHIKCLGLAILLAKNIAQGCPVVIFDDVVNAIDDEHRDGIWRTFFEDGLLESKQVILTAHAEEFLHRIEQELGARRAASIKRYKFLPHTGEHELRVDTDPPTKNYVLLAQRAVAADEKREALRHARPALESLTDRLWTWLGRRGDGRIDIRLGGPRSPWELNNKCVKIRAAVERIAAQHEGAPKAVAALAALLSVSGSSIEWGYLNSGVHDSQRDHEFDLATVRRIVESVTALDEALDTLQHR